MNEQAINTIVEKVVSEVDVWVAIIGFGGVVVGSIIAIVGNVLMFKLQMSQQNKLDSARKNLLEQMLSNPKFEEGRSLDTLSKVTGTNAEECRKLLIEIGARGFTLKGNREGWTYVDNRPLNEQ